MKVLKVSLLTNGKDESVRSHYLSIFPLISMVKQFSTLQKRFSKLVIEWQKRK